MWCLYWWVLDMGASSPSGEDWLSIPLSEAMILCTVLADTSWTELTERQHQ